MNIYSVLRNKLIQIPFLCKMGTLRRELLAKTQRNMHTDIDGIKIKYSKGNSNVADGKYFIVFEEQPQGGLFVYLVGCMTQIAYALQNDFIPVVDMLNFPSNLKNKEQTDINAWELYFKQPRGISVQDVYGAKNIAFHGEEKYNVLFIGDVTSEVKCERYQTVIDESKEFKEWYLNVALMNRFQEFWNKNMRYSDQAQAYIESQYQKLFSNKQKVLGVLCRGTDYISLKPKGHYVQPTAEMIVAKIEDVMAKYHCEYVFCATEDAGIFLKLKDFLGDKMLSMDVERVHYKEGYLLKDLYASQGVDIYQRQLDYLTEVELLSGNKKIDSIISDERIMIGLICDTAEENKNGLSKYFLERASGRLFCRKVKTSK